MCGTLLVGPKAADFLKYYVFSICAVFVRRRLKDRLTHFVAVYCSCECEWKQQRVSYKFHVCRHYGLSERVSVSIRGIIFALRRKEIL